MKFKKGNGSAFSGSNGFGDDGLQPAAKEHCNGTGKRHSSVKRE